MEPTTFAAVKAMEALGYVERKHLPGNKKNIHVFLTASGKKLKKELIPLAVEVNEIGTRDLTDTEIQMTRKVLLSIISNMADDEATWDEEDCRLPSNRELSRRIGKPI